MVERDDKSSRCGNSIICSDVVKGAELTLLRTLSVGHVQKSELMLARSHGSTDAGIHSPGCEDDCDAHRRNYFFRFFDVPAASPFADIFSDAFDAFAAAFPDGFAAAFAAPFEDTCSAVMIE